jgi:hypothetical protein
MTKSLSHTRWMCKYHIAFTPKYRRKIVHNKYKASIVEILRDLCKWKGVEIIERKAARVDFGLPYSKKRRSLNWWAFLIPAKWVSMWI